MFLRVRVQPQLLPSAVGQLHLDRETLGDARSRVTFLCAGFIAVCVGHELTHVPSQYRDFGAALLKLQLVLEESRLVQTPVQQRSTALYSILPFGSDLVCPHLAC